MITSIGGKKIFPIGLGTWYMGGVALGGMIPSTAADAEDIRALKHWLNKGANFIDTAELYSAGHAEELVAQAIKGRDREKLFITTKVSPAHMRHNDVINAANASLRRLNCKYIDLYLIHWPSPFIKLEETLGAMEELVDAGVIRHIGVSNFDTHNVQEAMSKMKKYEIIANQIHYSLFKKDAEDSVIPFCQKNNIKVIAYTPLEKGRVAHMGEVIEMAKKYDKTPIQIGLNYLMKKSIPIPKSSDIKHINEILGSVGWGLTEDDYKILSQIN